MAGRADTPHEGECEGMFEISLLELHPLLLSEAVALTDEALK